MKTFGFRRTLVLALPFFAYQHSAEEVSNQLEDEIIEEVLIIGTREAVRELPGSGAIIDSEEIDRFDHVDLNQVLGSVPGLYIREEDGYGLRPNIGIRGASADRRRQFRPYVVAPQVGRAKQPQTLLATGLQQVHQPR